MLGENPVSSVKANPFRAQILGTTESGFFQKRDTPDLPRIGSPKRHPLHLRRISETLKGTLNYHSKHKEALRIARDNLKLA